MCFIKMSSGNGESAANEPQPLISQQSMLTNQGCSKCTSKEESAVSPSHKKLGARLPPAHFPRSHPQLAPTSLAAQLSLCSQGAPLSVTGRRENPHSQQRTQRRKCPSCPPLSASRELLSCIRKFPTIPISLLAGPPAPACVSGLSYNYSLPAVFPKFLTSDVHINLFCSHMVLQIQL